RPLFPYFAGPRTAQVGTARPGPGRDTAESDPGVRAFTVLLGDFVATDEGTGIVHMAPGFGEDDQRVCESAGIAVVCPVDETGRFTAEVPDYAGAQVFEANAEIV
ncbi:MAG: class I tRNA ligase family protein, partial [Thermoplasmata archaeon]|nr:class I tRNA ligase family protein [Thermoplasmata archaeon]